MAMALGLFSEHLVSSPPSRICSREGFQVRSEAGQLPPPQLWREFPPPLVRLF